MKLFFDNQIKAKISNEVKESICKAVTADSIDLKSSYEAIYNLVDAKHADHFVFTSSGTEAVNHIVLAAYLDITRKNGKNHFVTPNTAEAAPILAMSRLQEMGCILQMAPVNALGEVTVQSVVEALSPRTVLLSMSWADGLTGVIHPIAEIAKVCKERGVLFHVDATHVLGKGYYSLPSSGADFLTFNGEQLHAPQGTGALFIKEGVESSPFIVGGSEQAHMRSGSFNEALLTALSVASSQATEGIAHLCLETARLRDLFEILLTEKLKGASVLCKEAKRVPHISALFFPHVTSDALLYLLQEEGLFATFGGNSFQHIFHILKATGFEGANCHSGISFAFSKETTEEDIRRGVDLIVKSVKQLQKYSEHLIGEVIS